jgi:hypothetical protein
LFPPAVKSGQFTDFRYLCGKFAAGNWAICKALLPTRSKGNATFLPQPCHGNAIIRHVVVRYVPH